MLALVGWSAAAWAAPSATVTPSTDLVDLQQVNVDVNGFSANVGVVILMCTAGATTDSECDLSPSTSVTTDASGHASTTFSVRRIITTLAGDTDCAATPTTCVLAAAKPDRTEVARVALQFDPDVPPVPDLAIGVSIKRRAAFDDASGTFVLSGTVTCTRPMAVTLEGEMLQVVGFDVGEGAFFVELHCTKEEEFVVAVRSHTVEFRAKRAIVRLGAAGIGDDTGENVFVNLSTVVAPK
jgi:Neocarzinostatin family